VVDLATLVQILAWTRERGTLSSQSLSRLVLSGSLRQILLLTVSFCCSGASIVRRAWSVRARCSTVDHSPARDAARSASASALLTGSTPAGLAPIGHALRRWPFSPAQHPGKPKHFQQCQQLATHPSRFRQPGQRPLHRCVLPHAEAAAATRRRPTDAPGRVCGDVPRPAPASIPGCPVGRRVFPVSGMRRPSIQRSERAICPAFPHAYAGWGHSSPRLRKPGPALSAMRAACLRPVLQQISIAPPIPDERT